MFLRKPFFFLLTVCLNALTVAQDLRGSQRRSLVLCWLFDCPNRDDNNEKNNNNSDSDNNRNSTNNSNSTSVSPKDESDNDDTGFLNKVWCGIFRNCEDKTNKPVSEIATDVVNSTDGSNPIQEALNASQGSDTPLQDFFSQLLGQDESDEPVRDFLEEAFNRSDTVLLDFVAELFETVQNVSAEGFVSQVFNGTQPVGSYVTDWLTEDVFGDLNCTDEGPTCAYSIEGDEGVWVCRSIQNPFKLDSPPVNQTLCSPPNFTFVDNDRCGSCDGNYPTPCTCSCDFVEGNGDGVLVTLDGGVTQQCVNKNWATGALVTFDALSCFTAC